MVLTKLLNIRTFKFEQVNLASMPPYAAVSHVWADELYPPECANSITATEPPGMNIVMSAFEHEDLQKIDYCWIDTWCIDQDDEADKEAQIPKMDKIYKNSQAMAITVKHTFSFSQQDWDDAFHELRDDIEWYEQEYPGPDISSSTLRLERFIAKPHAKIAMDYIIEVAGLHWNRRIWTAQEYVLAQKFFWVDGNLSRLQASDTDMQNVHQIFISVGSTDKNRAHAVDLNNLLFTNGVRTKYRNPYEIMQLSQYRDSQNEVDKIYGLMAASEVIITPVHGETFAEAWQRWWESAIGVGHLYFALLATLKGQNAPSPSLSSNCIMPPAEVHAECIGRARLRDVPRMGPSKLDRGTLTIWGRRVGKVSIDICLGKDAEIPSKITELLTLYKRSTEITERFLLAVSAAYQDSRKIVARIMRRLQQLARCNDTDDTRSPIHGDIDKIYASWSSELPSELSRRFPGKLYLGTLSTGKDKIDVIIPSADPIPQGKLLAIDFNATELGFRGARSTQVSERKRLMIVQSPGIHEPSGRGLHKISMTLAISYWESEEQQECYAHEEIRLWCPQSAPTRPFSIGGEACSYCRSCREGTNRTQIIPCIWDMPEQELGANGSLISGTMENGKRKGQASAPSRYSKRLAVRPS